MAYNITKIVNNSSKSVVLTNPRAERDRHVLTSGSTVTPRYSPKVEVIKDSDVPYNIAVKKALNIYTSKNNWCFWDNGAGGLVGVGDGDSPLGFMLPRNPPVTKLSLVVSEDGVPRFLPDGERYIPINIETQQRLNWCWAASTASIANYYKKTKDWKQCELANFMFDRTNCCSSLNCDSPAIAWDALQHTGNAGGIIKGGISIGQIISQIDLGQPISLALTSWAGNHNVVITGYNNRDPNNPKIEVKDSDPFSWTVVCNFKGFPGSYSIIKAYKWGEAYFTKP